jgi:hypothetical protein
MGVKLSVLDSARLRSEYLFVRYKRSQSFIISTLHQDDEITDDDMGVDQVGCKVQIRKAYKILVEDLYGKVNMGDLYIFEFKTGTRKLINMV